MVATGVKDRFAAYFSKVVGQASQATGTGK